MYYEAPHLEMRSQDPSKKTLSIHGAQLHSFLVNPDTNAHNPKQRRC